MKKSCVQCASKSKLSNMLYAKKKKKKQKKRKEKKNIANVNACMFYIVCVVWCEEGEGG